MSRERGLNPFRLERADIIDALSSGFGTNSACYVSSDVKTVSSSYQDGISGNTPENLDVFPLSSNRSIRDTANMPIFVEDTHESNSLSRSRDFNCAHNSNTLTKSTRLHNATISSALEALQGYGRVAQSPSHSPKQKDWNADFFKNVNINKPTAMLPAYSTGMLKSEDPYSQINAVESLKHGSNTSNCKPFNDLNLKNVDEEDEFLYGDSNSLPEVPKSSKNDSNQGNSKPKPEWSDEEDLFVESPNTCLNKLNASPGKSSFVWNRRHKVIESKSSQIKPEANITSSISENKLPETFSGDSHLSSISSTKHQIMKQLSLNKVAEKNEKTFVSNNNSKIASTSGFKSKYHVAAELLKKPNIEKSKNLINKAIGSSALNDPNVKKCNRVTESFRSDINESKLTAKTGASIKNSKQLKTNKVLGKTVKQLPKAFLQKDLDGIKDYVKGAQQKRIYPQEEYEREFKHPRHEGYRDLSPLRHSSYELSRHRSPVNEYRHRSPCHSRRKSPVNNTRYRSPPYHSKQKSPHRDYERRGEHSSRHYEGRRHYSPSPGRKSRERSPGNHRYLRSPGLRRSQERSRSPGFYRSREKNYEDKYKKDSYRSREVSLKSASEHYHSRKRKKSHDYSSDDSFCSLSFESESVSSDSSTDSSYEKEKSSKHLPKTKIPENTKISKVDCTKMENKAGEDICVKSADITSLPDDISQNIADICNFQDKTTKDVELSNDVFKYFNKDEEDKLINIVKMFENCQNSQIINELVEGVQEHSSMLASSAPSIIDMTHNIHNLPAPSPPVPSISFPTMSGPHPYSVMPPVPMSFPPSHVNSFHPLMFPPPSAGPAMPPTSVYGPFPISVPSVDVSRMSETKQAKKRPTTLRPIHLTQNVNVKNISDKPSSNEYSQSSAAKSTESTEKIIEKEKAACKELMCSTKPISEQNALLIEKFKKLSTERHVTHLKVDSYLKDIVYMREMIATTFGKKLSSSDKVIHSKCKNLVTVSVNSMRCSLKEVKRLDEELRRLKAKLPKGLQGKVANIKIELPKEVGNTTEFYSCYDSHNHTCYLCYRQFSNLLCIMEHFHSTEHKERMSTEKEEWMKKFQKPELKEESRKCVLQPVEGVEFIKPITGFVCTLCSETLINIACAEQHLKSHDHFVQYKNHIKMNPVYERKSLFRKYIQHSILAKEKRQKEMEEKEVADEKVKEIIKDQKSKEKIVELEEVDDADAPISKNSNLTGIKLTLSSEKEKTRQMEKGKGAKASATKPIQKVVYIGKAPNYKSRPQPWYKRDIYQKNSEYVSDVVASTLPTINVTTTTLPTINVTTTTLPTVIITSKAEENVSVPIVGSSTLANEPEVSTKTNLLFLEQNIVETNKKKQKAAVSKAIEYTCLTQEESKNLNAKSSDLNNIPVLANENNLTVLIDPIKTCDYQSTKQPYSVFKEKDTINLPESLVNKSKHDKIMSVTEDLAVSRKIKNILPGTDSSMHLGIPLSEIKLPETPIQSLNKLSTNTEMQCESNKPIPMEIDDSPDKYVSISDSRLLTEEDRDFFILGINKDDLKPLVVPVPPPSSLLNCASPSHIPTSVSVTCDSSLATNNSNLKASIPMSIPVSISSHLSKSTKQPNSKLKKQTLECKSNKSKRTLITIVPTNNLFQSDNEKTDVTTEEVSELITKCETSESLAKNQEDVIAKACVTSCIDKDIEGLSDREQNILQQNKTVLEAAKTLSVKVENDTKCANQPSVTLKKMDAKNANTEISSNVEDIKIKVQNMETLISNLYPVAAISQDHTEKPTVVNQSASSVDNHVTSKSTQIEANASLSKSESFDSFVPVGESVDISIEVSVLKNCDKEDQFKNLKTEVVQNSLLNSISKQTSTFDLGSTSTQQFVEESVAIVSEIVPVYNVNSVLSVSFPEVITIDDSTVESETMELSSEQKISDMKEQQDVKSSDVENSSLDTMSRQTSAFDLDSTSTQKFVDLTQEESIVIKSENVHVCNVNSTLTASYLEVSTADKTTVESKIMDLGSEQNILEMKVQQNLKPAEVVKNSSLNNISMQTSTFDLDCTSTQQFVDESVAIVSEIVPVYNVNSVLSVSFPEVLTVDNNTVESETMELCSEQNISDMKEQQDVKSADVENSSLDTMSRQTSAFDLDSTATQKFVDLKQEESIAIKSENVRVCNVNSTLTASFTEVSTTHKTTMESETMDLGSEQNILEMKVQQNVKSAEAVKNSSLDSISMQTSTFFLGSTSTQQFDEESVVTEIVPVCNVNSLLSASFPEVLTANKSTVEYETLELCSEQNISEMKEQLEGKSKKGLVFELPSNVGLSKGIFDTEVCSSTLELEQPILQREGPERLIEQFGIEPSKHLVIKEPLEQDSYKESASDMEISVTIQEFVEKCQSDISGDSYKGSVFDLTVSKLDCESHDLNKSKQAESKSYTPKNLSICNLESAPKNFSENQSECTGMVDSEVQEFSSEQQAIQMKGNEIVLYQEFVSKQLISLDQSESSMLQKTSLCTVDTSLSEKCLNEDENITGVSKVEEAVSEQQTTWQQHDVKAESISSEGNKTGDCEPKTSLSGIKFETGDLPKSDTDTDEYENGK